MDKITNFKSINRIVSYLQIYRSSKMQNFLLESEVVNFSDPNVKRLAQELAEGTKSDEEIAKNC